MICNHYNVLNFFITITGLNHPSPYFKLSKNIKTGIKCSTLIP